jgi:hypothetical protein
LTHFLGILTSEAFYTVIESEIKKLVSPQKKIEILKSTFRELHESYVEMNTKHTSVAVTGMTEPNFAVSRLTAVDQYLQPVTFCGT